MQCGIWILTFLFGIIIFPITTDSTDFYTAGVYEHIVRGTHEGLSLKETILMNLGVYDEVCKQASEEGVDVLVFPEAGATGYNNAPPEERNTFFSVPDPNLGKWNPCLQSEFENNFILRNLSCMAREYKMVVTFNIFSRETCDKNSDSLCPKDEFYLYNTNIVFDKNGILLARYYKHNLFFEDGVQTPHKTSLSYFDTDFGRFGTFTCFDIFYIEAVELVEKHNITNILYPNYWLDLLPLYNAMQTHSSWAYNFNVNFVSANVHCPNTGSIGSGIYSGNHGMVVGTNSLDGISRLLIARLPKNPQAVDLKHFYFKTKVIEIVSRHKPDLNLTYNYNSFKFRTDSVVELMSKKASLQVCSNGLCCNIEYESPNLEGRIYFGASKDRLNVGDTYFIPHEVCSLYYSPDGENFTRDSPIIFSSIKISGSFSYKYMYPSVIGSSLTPVSTSFWNYTNEDSVLNYKDPNQENTIVSIVLLARIYGDDIMTA